MVGPPKNFVCNCVQYRVSESAFKPLLSFNNDLLGHPIGSRFFHSLPFRVRGSSPNDGNDPTHTEENQNELETRTQKTEWQIGVPFLKLGDLTHWQPDYRVCFLSLP